VGLASKVFSVSSVNYMLIAFGGNLQPSYFLADGSGNILARLAYQNGYGYETNQVLPNVNSNSSVYSIAYLIRDLLVSANKTQGATVSNGIYTQAGVNVVNFNFNSVQNYTAELATNLHITGRKNNNIARKDVLSYYKEVYIFNF
jgi:hypothetical protein